MPLKVWHDKLCDKLKLNTTHDQPLAVEDKFDVTFSTHCLDPPPYQKKVKPCKIRIERDVKQFKAMSLPERVRWIVETAPYWPMSLAAVMEVLHKEQTVKGKEKLAAASGAIKKKTKAMPTAAAASGAVKKKTKARPWHNAKAKAKAMPTAADALTRHLAGGVTAS